MSRSEEGGEIARPNRPTPPGEMAKIEVTDEGRRKRWDDDPDEDQPTPVAAPPPSWRSAAPAPAGAEVPGPTADEVAEHYAGHLKHTSSSGFLYFSMAGAGLFKQTDALAYKKYRDRLLADCGAPDDPIEIMLIEQLALGHMNTGRLHFKSATADGLEAARTYGALAVALAGEFRRGALALKSYRERPQAGEAKVSAARAVSAMPEPREGADTEQGSKPGGDDHDGATIPLAESPSSGGGPIEPVEKARPKRRRA